MPSSVVNADVVRLDTDPLWPVTGIVEWWGIYRISGDMCTYLLTLTMPHLDVPGATIYYEVCGEGPPLLFIPGAQGTGAIFHETAQLLASHFSVVCWDRRGFSNSVINGSFDINNKLEADADDAQRLISHISKGPAYVYGSSNGAIVALELLKRNPQHVRKAIIHEPPAFDILPPDQRKQAIDATQMVYDKYRSDGPIAGMQAFASMAFRGDDIKYGLLFLDPGRGGDVRANHLYWYEFEMRQYTSAPPDIQSLHKVKEKVIPSAGRNTLEHIAAMPPSLISQKLGVSFVTIEGGHMPYYTDPETFARDLKQIFSP